MNTYDYIILGAGASGLLLADAMAGDAFFSDKKILVLDKDAKQTNDRTWCFWEKQTGDFDHLVHRSWKQIYFGGARFSKQLAIAPYTYKMLRGKDFYAYYMTRLAVAKNISFVQETVLDVLDIGHQVRVATQNKVYTGTQVFNSIFDPSAATAQKKYPFLQQHFVGWFVKTSTPVFYVDRATFMDFSIPQKGNTRFMYVLPFSETEALVEYTLFSEELLPETEYDKAIAAYLLQNLQCTEYTVLEKEKGAIPMSCYNFAAHNTPNILHIGTAGGWAKPSTGYTFRNTAKNTKALISHIKKGKRLTSFPGRTKFWYYDLLLLDVLQHDNSKGQKVFESLFKKRHPKRIFQFLDEETNLWEDLGIIAACPKMEFINALFRRLF